MAQLSTTGIGSYGRDLQVANPYNQRMAILKVARLGHPVLRAKALPVPPAEISSVRIQRLIDDMFETMHEYAGIGLAGPQVHEGVRVFVAGLRAAPLPEVLDGDEEMPFLALINPEIELVGSPTHEGWEGCLSIPDIRGLVPRASGVRVRAYGRDGRTLTLEATGLAARVIQHENDHLDGVLFFDRMTSLATLTYMDEYRRHWMKDDEE
jgi:peptide deformylase